MCLCKFFSCIIAELVFLNFIRYKKKKKACPLVLVPLRVKVSLALALESSGYVKPCKSCQSVKEKNDTLAVVLKISRSMITSTNEVNFKLKDKPCENLLYILY